MVTYSWRPCRRNHQGACPRREGSHPQTSQRGCVRRRLPLRPQHLEHSRRESSEGDALPRSSTTPTGCTVPHPRLVADNMCYLHPLTWDRRRTWGVYYHHEWGVGYHAWMWDACHSVNPDPFLF